MNLIFNIKRHFLSNAKLYIIIGAAFVVGIVAALLCVAAMNENEAAQITLYIDDFFKNISQTGVDGTVVLCESVYDSIKTVILGTMFSLMVIGAPFVLLLCATCGFSSAFVVFFLLRVYGFRSFLFILLALLPHWIILMPTYTFFWHMCLDFSVSAYSGIKKQNKRLASLLLSVLCVLLLSFCASLIKAYVEPWLICIIAKYYI